MATLRGAQHLFGGGVWQAGVCSPSQSAIFEIDQLASLRSPSLFLLLEGRVTLVFANALGELHELPLEPGAPVLVSQPYAAYCPDGPHEGVALVVERSDLHRQWQPPPHLEW